MRLLNVAMVMNNVTRTHLIVFPSVLKKMVGVDDFNRMHRQV